MEVLYKNENHEGFRMMESTRLTHQDLIDAVAVLESIILNSSETERKEKYLFKEGLLKASQNYERTKAKYEKMSLNEKIEFRVREEQYKEKIKNLNPLINLLINIKSIL